MSLNISNQMTSPKIQVDLTFGKWDEHGTNGINFNWLYTARVRFLNIVGDK